MSPQNLYYECLDKGDARQCSIPTWRYALNMQQRYAAARVTVERYTGPVQTPQKTFSPYGDSDEESDCSPPLPKKTNATEMKKDEILLRLCLILKLIIMGSSFKHRVETDIVFVLLRNAFLLGGKNITLIMIIQFVWQDSSMVKVYFNIVMIKGMIIMKQLPFILQICLKMERD